MMGKWQHRLPESLIVMQDLTRNTSIVINILAAIMVVTGCVGFLDAATAWGLPIGLGCFMIALNQVLNWLITK